MPHLLNPESIDALGRALCGTYTLPVSADGARVICESLPGRAIVVAARVGDELVVVIDLDKPSAPRHARAMLREWRDLHLAGLEPGEHPDDEAFADPRRGERGPLRLVVAAG